VKRIAAYIYKRPFLTIALFTVIAYLPIFLPFFYIKNDLVSQMLPMRFFVSESLQSGYMPWWNPYVNFGIPQYGDMNGAFWNPIVWLISIFWGYNIWTITLELMFYIFLSGWGMYLLLKNLNITKQVALIGSFSYLSCGYIIGHLQHSSWVTGAAFLPFIFLYFIRINRTPEAKYFFYGSLSFFMFLSSAHPGIIIGAVYFFFFCIVGVLLVGRSEFKKNWHRRFIKNNALFFTITLLLSVGILIGYADVIPYITRGEMVSGNESLINPTSFQSWISILFPLVVHKSNFYNTDISMRNMHIGIVMLAGFFAFFRLADKKAAFITFIIFLFFFLLSSGGIFKLFANKIIPGIAYVRSSGEFSLFTLFIIITAGAYGWQLYNNIAHKKGELLLLKWLKYFFGTGIVLSLISMLVFQNTLLLNLTAISFSDFIGSIKTIIDGLTITDLFLIQSCLSLLFILILETQSSRSSKLKYVTIAAYLIVTTWLCLPFTGLGSKSKKEINSILSAAPKGIHIQPLKIADKSAFIDTSNFLLAGLPNVFSKQICIPALKEYPIGLKTNASLFEDAQRMQFIQRQAYIFLSKDSSFDTEASFDSSYIHIIKSGPCFIEAEINNEQFNYFTYTQNNYPYWKAYINKQPASHFTGFGSFLTLQIPKGKFVVRFEFYPRPVAISAYFTLVLFFISIITLILLERKVPFKKTDSHSY